MRLITENDKPNKSKMQLVVGYLYFLLPKAMTRGVRINRCLQLIPNTSSSGMALRNSSAHKNATAFAVTNRAVENGG